MRTFQFPLERVLHWRRTQLEAERARVEQLARRRVALEETARKVEADRVAAELSIAHAGALPSRDLHTLSAYQARAARERIALDERRQVLDRETAAQLALATEAQRRVKLLERLRAGRMRAWQSAVDTAEESFAAETWLGRWPGPPQ